MAFYFDSFGFYKIVSGGGSSNPSKNIYVAQWDNTYGYNTDSIVAYNGVFYKSLINSNIGNLPTNNTAWAEVTNNSGQPPYRAVFSVSDWISDGAGAYYLLIPASVHQQNTNEFVYGFISANGNLGHNIPFGYGDFIQESNGDIKFLSDFVFDGFLTVTSFTGAPPSSIVEDWVSGTNYSVGNLVVYDNILYRCIHQNSSIVFNPSEWQVIGSSGGSTDYNDLINKPILNTDNSAPQTPDSSEEIQGIINLHKISKTGDYSDLLNVPDIPEPPMFTNYIFVDVNGSDTTGDGSVSNPYASGYKAMDSIVDATPTQRYAIKYGVGFFTETQDIVHKPNVWIMADSTYSTRVIFSGTYSLSPSFSGTSDNRFGFIDIYIDGILNIDMFAVSATNSRMYNRGCQFNKAITFKAYAATSRFYLFFCETFNTATITGGYVHAMGTVFNGLVTANSLALTSCNMIFSNSYLPNGLTVNNPLSTEYIDVWLMNSMVRSTLTVGGWSGLHYSFGTLPPLASRSFASTIVLDARENQTITNMLNPRKVVSSNIYYASNLDYIIAITDTSVVKTIYLPSTSMMNDGAILVIKDESGLASINNIIINRSGTDTINGATNVVIDSNYGVVKLYKGSAGKWYNLDNTICGNSNNVSISTTNEPSSITEISRGLITQGINADKIKNVVVNGNYAYTLCMQNPGFLQIFDISDRALPVTKGYLSLNNGCNGIVYSNNKVYICGNTGLLWIVDVSNPDSPTLLGSCLVGTNNNLWDLVLVGSYVYVANAGNIGGSRGLCVIDVSNPALPVLISKSNDYNAFGIATNGTSHIFVADGTNTRIKSYNISAPATPTFVQNLTVPQLVESIDYFDGYLYCGVDYGAVNKAIYIVDVRNPASMNILSTIVPNGGAVGTNECFVLNNSYLYCFSTNGSTGTLEVFNVINKSLPLLKFTKLFTASAYNGNGTIGAGFVDQNYIYLPQRGSKCLLILTNGIGSGSIQTIPHEGQIKEYTLLDNQITPVVLFKYPASVKDLFLNIAVEKNASGASGIICRSGNGSSVVDTSSVLFNSSYGVGHGITIVFAINNGFIECRYTSTSTGANGVARVKINDMWGTQT